MSYGHGPLADHIDKSPEPVEFARLIQHIERGEIVGCTANCDQGRNPCPCPDACRLAADSMEHYHNASDFVLACCIVVGVFTLVALAAWASR